MKTLPISVRFSSSSNIVSTGSSLFIKLENIFLLTDFSLYSYDLDTFLLPCKKSTSALERSYMQEFNTDD